MNILRSKVDSSHQTKFNYFTLYWIVLLCTDQYLTLLPVSWAAAELSTVKVDVWGTLVSAVVFHLPLLGEYPL